MLYVGQLSQTLAIGPTKLSVLLFYRRIWSGRFLDVTTWALMAFVTSWIVVFFFSNMLECIPIKEAWTSDRGLNANPHCSHAVSMHLAQGYLDVAIDTLILVVPIPLG